MPEPRDPTIKLFGRNIPVPEDSSHLCDSESPTVDSTEVLDKFQKMTKTEVKEATIEKTCKEMFLADNDEVQENSDQCLTSDNRAKAIHELEEDQGVSSDNGSNRKILKKPDKLLPCPRCDSLETKFCYFNNYNVNQPRHFCKKCQRYWTAGGTMRNVPIGAGRRKNKPLSSQYCQMVGIPLDGSPFTQGSILESASHQHLSCVGLPVSSRPDRDAPPCKSGVTVFDLKDQKKSAEMCSVAVGHAGKEEPSSSGSSLTSASFQENKLPESEIELRNYDSSTPTPPAQFYPGPTWGYPWNPMMLGPNGSNPIAACIGSPPMMLFPGFCTIPYGGAAYWGSMTSGDARSCNVPSSRTTGSLSSSQSNSKSACSRSGSPPLGKHLRERCSMVEEETEQCLWVPKTMRINDLGAAAKSSMWDTLNFKPKKNDPVIKGGIFKAFQPKSDTSSDTSDSDKVLQANPAALSRSQLFQESG